MSSIFLFTRAPGCLQHGQSAHVRIALKTKRARFLYAGLLNYFIDTTICISRFIKNHYALPETRAIVVYNAGPDLALFNPQRDFAYHPNIDTGKIVVGTIAQIPENKRAWLFSGHGPHH